MMALVAYSDESDLSENEESSISLSEPNRILNLQQQNITNNRTSAINDIEDEDDSVHQSYELGSSNSNSRNLLATVPSVKTIQDLQRPLDVGEENDIVDDVPTVKSWYVTKEMQNSTKTESVPIKILVKKDKKNKLKFILPSLTEFADDSDDEILDQQPKKKIKVSSSGSGVFALLPKPKGVTALVPLTVSRRQKSSVPVPVKKKNPVLKKPAPILKNDDSDEDDDSNVNTKDFFSFSDNDRVPILPLNDLPEVSALPLTKSNADVNIDNLCSNVVPVSNIVNDDCDLSHNLIKPLPLDEDIESPSCSTDVSAFSAINNEEALLKLAGKRNKGQIINLIDIKADDALMSKDEWMTRSLNEVKPTRSYSKKQDGVPTSQQKRKHHITYLAHQAQEREQDLQIMWGQNRQTKMQTQSRYGF